MAQALEKTEETIGFFAQKMVKLFEKLYFVFGEIQFCQKSLTHRKKQPHSLPQKVLVQQSPPNIILLLLQAPNV